MSETSQKTKSQIKKLHENIYDWQPGNGTRYCVALTDTGNGKLLTWLDRDDVGGTSFLFIDVAQVSVSVGYFMEKIRLRNEADACALLDFAVYMGVVKEFH